METKQTVGTFDYVALDIAQRDAEDRVRNINSRTEANTLLAIAQRDGNRVLVKAVNALIEKKWPANKTNYATNLTNDNTNITNMLRAWVSNTFVQDLALSAREAKITNTYRDEQYAIFLNSIGWIDDLNNLATAADKAVATETENLNAAIHELTVSYGNVNERLLNEMRDSKAWERLSRELETLTDQQALARVLENIATSDPDKLRMLITEAPSYLTSRGVENADKYIREVLIKDIPQVATADAIETNADLYRQAAKFNAQWAKKYIERLPAATLTIQSITKEAEDTLITPEKLDFK